MRDTPYISHCLQTILEHHFVKTTFVSGCGLLIKEVNDTFKPLAIFHIVVSVGLESPLSICPIIVLLTPVN